MIVRAGSAVLQGGSGDCRSPSSLWNISWLGKRRLLPPTSFMRRRQRNGRANMARMEKKHDPPGDRSRSCKTFEVQSPESRRFPIPARQRSRCNVARRCRDSEAAKTIPTTMCPHCRRRLLSGTIFRNGSFPNGSCSSYLPHCPLGPKPGETNASCRDVEMAFGRRSLGCAGLQQTWKSRLTERRDLKMLFKVSLSAPRLSIVDRHGQAS